MTQTGGWCHVPEIELDVLGTIHCDADQARIFRVTSGGVYEMYVPAQLDVFEQRVWLEQISHVQQGDLADHRSVQLLDLGYGPFLLATGPSRGHICVGLHRRDDSKR